MNRKLLGIAVMLLSIAMLASPVMATPKESSPAWYSIDATDTYYEVSYEVLTEMCLDAGLSENPYPEPPAPTVNVVFPFLYVSDASEYYVFTFTIGDKEYNGISCTVFDMTLNLLTGNGPMTYTKATHFIGELGDMNHGFDGACIVNLYGYDTVNEYFTANWDMKGFGHFTGQSLTLTQDSRIDDFASGTCLVLGNRYK